MKKFKVNLQDKDGNVVLSHNLFAKDELDADKKMQVLLSSAKDKTVVSAKLF